MPAPNVRHSKPLPVNACKMHSEAHPLDTNSRSECRRGQKARPEGMMAYQETVVRRDQYRIYVRGHPRAGPPNHLLPGFSATHTPHHRSSPSMVFRTPYPFPPFSFLTSRRHAELFCLIFLAGAVRISHPAIPIPPPIKSVSWMPSSPNWGLSKCSLSRTTPRAHRPLTGH